jgi:hypothetical protein
MRWQGLRIRVGWVIRCVENSIKAIRELQEKSEVCYENGTRNLGRTE